MRDFLSQILKYGSAITSKVDTDSKKFKHLVADQLSLRHAVSQAVALNAPAGTIVLYVAGTASLITSTFLDHRNGSISIPLILLLSLIIYVLMSYSMYSFSRHISSAGGYYTFVSRGLGQSAGFITALSYLTYGILSFTGFGILGFLGFSYAILPSIGLSIPDPDIMWIPVSIFFIFLVSFLIYMGVKPSLKYVSYTIFIEIGFLIITSVALIVMYRNSLSVLPFTSAPLGNDPFAVFAMMVYSIGAYVGIGGSIPIAEETKKPKKNVPFAIIITVIILGVTIILSSYAQVIAWGFSNMFSFGSQTQPYPLLYIYRSKFGYLSIGLFLALIVIVLNSFFTATVSLGTNATRVLFSMSREGVLPRFLSATNKNNGTPTMAMITLAVISSVIVVVSGISFEYLAGLNPMNALLSSSVFLLILEAPIIYIVHILTNSSLYLFMKKRIKMHRADYIKYLIIPSLSTATLIMAVWAAVFFNFSFAAAIYASFIVIAIIIISAVIIRSRFKEKLQYLGDFSL